MALQKMPLAIQFAEGVDTKTDAKQVAVTKLLDLQNCVFTKNSTLSKRNGYRALGKLVDGVGTPYANPMGIAKRGTELMLFANAHGYSYRPSSDTWDDQGAVSSVVATGSPVARTGTAQTVADVAINGGIEVVAWEDSRGGVWCSVIEQVSQRILLVPTQLDASGQFPRVVAVGNVLHVLWLNGNLLWLSIVNPAAPESASAPMLLTSDVSTSYDVCPTFTLAYASGPALIAWGSATNGGYRLGYIDASGVLGSPITGLPSVGTIATTNPVGAIACSYCPVGGTGIIVAYGYTGGVGSTNARYQFHVGTNLSDVTGHSGTLSTGITAAVPINLTVEFSSTTTVWWAVERTGSTLDAHLVQSGSVTTGGTVTASTSVRGHVLGSRAFYDAGDVYCAITHPVLYFPYVAIVQLSASMRAQARLLPGASTGAPVRAQLPACVPLGGGPTSRQHLLALGYRIQLSGTSGTQFGEAGIQAFTLDFDHDDAYRYTELGGATYLSGALIQHYDGDRWAESDFHCAPDTTSGTIETSQTTGGGLTTTNAYNYKLVYEEIDGQGLIHPGAVSVATMITLSGSNDAVVLTIPTYRLTSKRRVRVSVFRSLGNATGDPQAIEFFRVSSVDPTTAGSPNGYLLNDPTVDSVSFTDNMSDATAKTLEPLYTNGGVLANDPIASGGEVIAGGKYRLFWTDPLDGDLVNYSKQLADSDTAAEMSPLLSQRLDPFGGDIVAIALMDDNVVVFKETAIYAFGGPGPDADGGATTSDAFTPAQLLTSDVGCKSRSSVCQMPLGVVFQSDKGIYLLGRDLSVRRIGDPVFAYNSQTITRSTLLPDRPHVVFLTDSGWTLLYDYDRNAWSKFSNHEGHDAVVVAGTYYYLRADGRVFAETPGSYSDGEGQHIPMLIETAWIKLVGYLQSWQRILYAQVLGTYLTPHTLRLRYRLDYEPAYSAPLDADVNSVYTPDNYGDGNYGDGPYGGIVGVSATVYQEAFHLNQRCQSISFRIEDLELAGDFGASFELSELLLVGGVLGPRFLPGAARSQ